MLGSTWIDTFAVLLKSVFMPTFIDAFTRSWTHDLTIGRRLLQLGNHDIVYFFFEGDFLHVSNPNLSYLKWINRAVTLTYLHVSHFGYQLFERVAFDVKLDIVNGEKRFFDQAGI